MAATTMQRRLCSERVLWASAVTAQPPASPLSLQNLKMKSWILFWVIFAVYLFFVLVVDYICLCPCLTLWTGRYSRISFTRCIFGVGSSTRVMRLDAQETKTYVPKWSANLRGNVCEVIWIHRQPRTEYLISDTRGKQIDKAKSKYGATYRSEWKKAYFYLFMNRIQSRSDLMPIPQQRIGYRVLL